MIMLKGYGKSVAGDRAMAALLPHLSAARNKILNGKVARETLWQQPDLSQQR